MSKWRCLLLVVAAGALIVDVDGAPRNARAADEPTSTPTSLSVPTVTIEQSTPVSVPTVTIPQPTATPTVTPKPTVTPRRTATPKVHRVKRHRQVKRAKPTPTPAPSRIWIVAYLTSYCPGSAGWLASSGMTVFYGMLANNYYPFGTHVYMPVIGITGVVEDRTGGSAWNHFDVWSPTCYSTPTGYYKVAILGK